MTKTRVVEISIGDLNTEKRPYRLVGMGNTGSEYDYSPYIVIEYLDVYEYAQTYIWKTDDYTNKGWGIYETYIDADNEPCAILRRVKSESKDGVS